MSPAWKRLGVAALTALGMTQVPTACFSRGAESPSKDSALIDKCTAEARAAYHVGGASVEQAGQIYDECIRRGIDGGAP